MYYADSTITIRVPFMSTGLNNLSFAFEPLDRALEDFGKIAREAQRYRQELYRTMRTEECESRMRPREIPEAQFKKPTFVRRACGGRWRVMRA